MKNTIFVSIQHVHIAEIHHYTLIVSFVEIYSLILPTKEISNFVYMNVKFSKGPSASQVHKSEDIEKSLGRIKKPCICFVRKVLAVGFMALAYWQEVFGTSRND